jgi:hypothetical protein
MRRAQRGSVFELIDARQNASYVDDCARREEQGER